MFESHRYENKFARHRIQKIQPPRLKLHGFGDMLFSSLTPEYEKSLMKEIYGLRCIVGFTMDEIMDMPVADRRYFTLLHNERIEKENAAMEGKQAFGEEDMQSVRNIAEQANSKKNIGNK